MNISIVETPMELINAIEANIHFQRKDCKIFIHSFYEKRVFDFLLQRLQWSGEVQFIADRPVDWSKPRESYRERFARKRRIDRIIRQCRDVDYLFIDYVRFHMRHVANRVGYKKLILIDGGTDALRVAAMRFMPEERDESTGWRKTLRGIKAGINRKLFGWDISEIPAVTFFSSYDFEVRESDAYAKNNYQVVRQALGACEIVNCVYFLGQPLVEDGYVTPENYAKYMLNAVARIGDKEIVYVPHPRESSQNYQKLIRQCGMKVHKFEFPIEIELIVSGKIPSSIMSFFSSAIDNCRLIFGDIVAVASVRISRDDFYPGHAHVEEIYDYFATKVSKKFEVLEF